MKNILKYIKRLILSDSRESSKRAIMLYTMLLITFVVVVFTTVSNAIIILTTLCSFVLALAGVATWYNNRQSKNQSNE